MAKPYVPMWMTGDDALNLVVQRTGWDEVSAFSWLQDACDEGAVEARHYAQLLRRARQGDWVIEADRAEFISARVSPEMLRPYLSSWVFRRDNVTTLLAAVDSGAEAAQMTAASEAPAGAAEVPNAEVTKLAATGAPTAQSEISRNRPGPPAVKRIATATRLVGDYAGDHDRLASEKQEVLSNKYGVSRDTAEKARRMALEELRHNPDTTPIIDK